MGVIWVLKERLGKFMYEDECMFMSMFHAGRCYDSVHFRYKRTGILILLRIMNTCVVHLGMKKKNI